MPPIRFGAAEGEVVRWQRMIDSQESGVRPDGVRVPRPPPIVSRTQRTIEVQCQAACGVVPTNAICLCDAAEVKSWIASLYLDCQSFAAPNGPHCGPFLCPLLPEQRH